jgi:hypothetical protein
MKIDKSKERRYELAKNLLEKMYSELDYVTEKEKVAIILSRKPKFQALLLIDYMIENGHVKGKTTTEVYDMYFYCSESLGLQTMTKVELSKLLCGYFGFSTVPQRFGSKIERVFFREDTPAPQAQQPYSVIGTEQWEAASADEKMQIVKKVCSGDITVSYDDYEMMLNFMMGQGAK